MKVLATLFISLFMSGCSTMSDLKARSDDSYFVVEKDVYAVDRRGLYDNRFVCGLRPGKYVNVGQSSDGDFYFNPGNAVIFYWGPASERFLTNGAHTPYSTLQGTQLGQTGGPGGLVIPKTASKEAKLFYLINTNPEGDSSAIPDPQFAATTTMGGTAVGGATTGAIISMIKGSFEFPSCKLDTSFIKIEHKK